MWVPLQRDKCSYESQLTTNYLGYFQLTAKLWTTLLKANGSKSCKCFFLGASFFTFHI